MTEQNNLKDKLRMMVSGFGMLTETEVNLIVDRTKVQSFKKGELLLREGEVSCNCYFVLEGMVREYYVINEEEKSTNFYTEGQPVNSFTSYTSGLPARHFLVCAEPCILTVGSKDLEEEMIEMIPRLSEIIRQEVERNTGLAQDEMARFMTSSPEQRYLNILEHRPELMARVPQHQIASYIGVTPESLSRIRKRIFVNR